MQREMYVAKVESNEAVNKELWRIIEEFPEFEISTKANIRNIKTQKLRKTPISKRGYPVCSFMKNGKLYLRTLHTLYAKAFIPNPNNYNQINHIDGDKTNCCIENLEWCTSKQNNIHARLTGLHNSDGDKPVLQCDLNGNTIREFKSASEASRILKINRSNICNVCNCRKNKKGYTYKTYKNYIWKWKK